MIALILETGPIRMRTSVWILYYEEQPEGAWLARTAVYCHYMVSPEEALLVSLEKNILLLDQMMWTFANSNST